MYNEVSFIENIERKLELWEFDLVERELYMNYKKSKEVQKRFLSFLYFTGNFNKYNLEDINLEHEYFKVARKIKSITINYNNIESNFENKEIPKDIMFCCIMNEIYNNFFEFTVESILRLFKDFIYHSKNMITVEYFMFKLIQNCIIRKKNELFSISKFGDFRYHLLLRLFASNKEGSRKYYQFYIAELEKQLRNCKQKQEEPKIAVCMYGPMRGAWETTFRANLEILTELNADIFVFTWAEKQIWQKVGTGGSSWVARKLSKDFFTFTPKEIAMNAQCAINFPNIWNKLNRDIYEPLEMEVLQEFCCEYPNFKKFEVEKQSCFEEKDELFRLNVFKMYYGVYKSFEILRNYEEENKIRYDYVISMRSDSEIIGRDIKKEILSLKSNEVLDIHTDHGSGVGNVVGCRNTIENYSYLFNDSSFLNNEMFDYKSPHTIYFKWLAYHGVMLKKRNFLIEHRYTQAMKGYIMPDISEEMFLDFSHLKNKVGANKLKDFERSFLRIIQYFKGEFLEDLPIYTATQRIKNQLSYKLGQAMINNSKSLLGYIRMPYVLSYIKETHQKEQELYKQSIIQNPNLKLPPLESYEDYKEAIKIKNHLTYKLGAALIKANNVQGGGRIFAYIGFLKEVRRLKQEYKNKRL